MAKKSDPLTTSTSKPPQGLETMDDFMPQLGGDLAIELSREVEAARKGKPRDEDHAEGKKRRGRR